jgi:very-short-patch-repair endonuclease
MKMFQGISTEPLYPAKPRMAPVDPISLFNQLTIALRPLLEKRAGKTFQKLNDLCESPIELLLGATLLHHNEMDDTAFRYQRLVLAKNSQQAPDFAIIPQFRWHGFRIDFCILVRDFKFLLFIECDGADFHNLNHQQREADERKNAAFSDAGIKCLRFTGKDIHAYAVGCAYAVNQVLHDSCRMEI